MIRKRSGISQEKLAEELDVSRQSVSKWETGQAMPESDKLVLLSKYFGVSVDELINNATDIDDRSGESKNQKSSASYDLGVILCATGFVALAIFGILSLIFPSVSDSAAYSSTITINGKGIILISCIAVIALGITAVFKNHKRR